MESDFLSNWAKHPDLPPVLPISNAVDKAYAYVKGRANGSIVSAKTKFNKLNSRLMGGLELNTITTISAMSGAGKSTIAKEIRHSIANLNPDLKFKQIVFNLEMSVIAQINRQIVTQSKINMKTLYSIDQPLLDVEIEALMKYYNSLKKEDIYFVETSVTPETMVNILYTFWKEHCKEGNYTLIYEIDNLMLLEGVGEKDKIDKANYGLVALKKQIESEGGSSIGLVLNQMNRNIETVDRVTKPEMHKPLASDLMAASSTNFCSDYIIFVHIPAKLGLKKYTVRGLPTKILYPDNRIVEAAYLELIKNRSGAFGLTFFLHNNMHLFAFDEMSDTERESIYGKAANINSDNIAVVKLTNKLY